MSESIDLSRPIEAVHEDGRTSPAFIDSPGDMLTLPVVKVQALKFLCPVLDDMTICTAPTWRIRNVAEPQEAKGLDTVDTLSGEVGPEVVERMVALAKAMAGEMKPGVHYVSQIEPMRDEARAIVALLDPVIDPDEADVNRLMVREWTFENGDMLNDEMRRFGMDCLARGRGLERGER
jgi:hypothetical protein